jgi:xylan 1,4-beta-xylosidase
MRVILLLMIVWITPFVSASDSLPRNLFSELLGKSEAETTEHISAVWRQFTQGDAATERIYFEAADNTAYIADIGNGDVRSEGMSYGMMITVQLDRQDQFNRLWKWAYTHMRHADGPKRGYFAWQCKFDGTQIGNGVSASDGEVWIVTSLFLASQRWGDGEGMFNYSHEAQALLREMLHKPDSGEWTSIFNRKHHQVTFCPIGTAAEMTDPSYHVPAFFAGWSRWAEDPADRKFWSRVVEESRSFFRRNANPDTGLMSEYAYFDGRPYSKKAGKDEFGFDAWRTLAFVALDHAWGSSDSWEVERTDRVLRFLEKQGKNLVNRYSLDGKPISDTSSSGLIAMAAAAGVAASDTKLAKPFVQQLWEAPIPSGKWRYYNGLLTMLGLLQTSGRFRTYDAPAATQLEVAFHSFTYTGSDIGTKGGAVQPLPAGHFRNPILAGFFPDPSICRVGDDYYLVNSTFAYYPGLPIFHSRDLVNWTLIGHAINRPGQLDYRGAGVTRGLFAPALQYHDGMFYLVCTMIDGRGNFVVTATNPAGPWSDPVWLDFPGIDPSLFFDGDGRAWLVHNGDAPDNKPLYAGHRAVWLREFDPVAKRVTGEPRLLINGGVDLTKKPVWIEGPHIFKKDGWYYLTCAEGGTGPDHSQVVFRSRFVEGPFVPWNRNPILTQRDLDPTVPDAVTCTGHADLTPGPDGQWWAVFLACRPMPEGGLLTTGRETFLLPVTWTEDGWPLIMPVGERVPLVVPSPRGVSVSSELPAKLTGDYTWTDNFERPELDPLWLMLRAPEDKPLWRLDAEGHRLLIAPGVNTLSGSAHPAFLARRVQHARFAGVTELEVPKAPGVAAGLTLFQSEKNHYFFAVERSANGQLRLFVELADSNAPVVIHQIEAPDVKSIWLRIQADVNALECAWSIDGKVWTTFVAPEGVRPVSVQAAGGGLHFTGAVIGPHVRRIP